MSLVDTPAPTSSTEPSASSSSSSDRSDSSAAAPISDVGIDVPLKELTITSPASGKALAPAPNGMTPTPLPKPRVEALSEPSTTSTPATTTDAVVVTAEVTAPPAEPIVTPHAETPIADADNEATATSTAASEPAAAEAEIVPASATSTATEPAASEGTPVTAVAVPETPGVALGSVGDMQDALPEAEGAGEGTAESPEEQASTSSLKDDPGTPEECNLFVGDLARNLTEEKLEKAFSQHGRVMSVSIKRDRATGKNLGYGFVKLSSHQEARTAKEAMQGVELGGRRVRVGWAQKNTSLYVSGLNAGITTDMLVREFARFGPLDKELTTIKPGAKFGFVKFRYRLHAETAKKDLNERPAFDGRCPSLHIEWHSVEPSTRGEGSETADSTDGNATESSSSRADGGETSSQRGGHTRHSRGDGPNNIIHVQFEGEQPRVSRVNEAMIRRTFSQWEPITDVVIPSHRYNGVSTGPRQLPRCWGFVHFPANPDGERAAKDAVQALHGTNVSDMKVHCTMSRSSGNTWRKQGGMGYSGGRPRRHSVGGGSDDRGMIHGHSYGGGGRPARSSMESPGVHPGRGVAWGGNKGAGRHNAHMMHQRMGPHMQHPMHPHMQHPQHPHHMQPQHPYPQHPQHQQHPPMYAFPAAAAAGQYAVPGNPGAAEGGAAATAAAAAATGGSSSGGGGGGEMMMQTPYGMAPYSYMSFQGVPYAPAQQGYPMGYQQVYPGYSYPMDPSIVQGQVPAGAQPGGPQHASAQSGAPVPPPQQQQQQQQQQQPGTVPQTMSQTAVPHQQQQSHINAQQPQAQPQPHQRSAGQLHAQQQHHARSTEQRQQQQQHMGMGLHQAMMMSGHTPAAATAGLNVGVPPYMPVLYQLPQMQGVPAPEQMPDQSGSSGGTEGKHGGGE